MTFWVKYPFNRPQITLCTLWWPHWEHTGNSHCQRGEPTVPPQFFLHCLKSHWVREVCRLTQPKCVLLCLGVSAYVCESENEESWFLKKGHLLRKPPIPLSVWRSHALCFLRGAQGGGSEGKQGVIRPRRELSTFLPQRGHKITPTIINRAGWRSCCAVCVPVKPVCYRRR